MFFSALNNSWAIHRLFNLGPHLPHPAIGRRSTARPTPSPKFISLTKTSRVPASFQLFKTPDLRPLSELFVGPIPDEIDRLSNLVYLDVGANNFSGNIPPSIGRLSICKPYTRTRTCSTAHFPRKLETYPILRFWVWLIMSFPHENTSRVCLQHLDLSGNNLEGPIPGRLFSLNLTHVYLYHNKLSGEIPRPVEAMNLVEIDLSMNTLTGSIPEDFGKLQYLDFLNLFSNQLTGELPASIGLLPSLRDFRVFRNNLTGVLPPEFGLHSKLEGFEVSQNQFSGQLPENLCAGGVLQGVVAHTNNLSGEVPRSLGNCRTLRTFQLQNNRFSGEIPQGLWTSFNMSRLMLSNNSFSGELPREIAPNMSRVEISDNKFSGEIPATVASWTNLVVFQASNNLFSGRIPKEITNLSSLTTLLLNGNDFSGELPSEIISWRQLTTLDLSNNKLSGEIPSAIGSLPNLLNLDLSENQFSGEIPLGIGNLRLTSLNLSSNQLVGRIPGQFYNLAYENSFLNNADLCADDPILMLLDCNSELHESKGLSSRHLAIILPFVILISLAILVLSFFIVRDYRRKSADNENLIGSGGSGKVYRIIINHSNESVAVKKIWNTKELDYKLEKEFLAEVEILGSIRHSNIVKLLCCISSEDSKLLVYEYMENHSLDRWLHGNKKPSVSGTGSVYHTVLDWPTRLQIAVGAAQGLCYMHHECPTPIIHRDVKSSNILLDSEFKAKIADFGLAKMLTRHAGSHTMSVVAGSFGYFAPEYAYTAKVNAKVDVYSFGVVILELVTGREANNIDQNMNLVEWAWHHFSEDKPIPEILDPELRESSNLEEMIMVYKIGITCTRASPSTRPSMKEVLHALRSCCPEDGQGAKKKVSNIDVAPLLGSVSGTYLSSYKNSKKGFGFKEDGSMIFDV
ncbi:poly(A) polymerase-like isoform X1 [Hibiscus syriacus]|uniref:Poly(A) polymerase-like isoform X1 n=1 Tax=Hibiscus syriacus TaxID=106335 RepID=A0A6A3CSU1_HIBSY|nr:poly(A) polymerase-like isoform X1 [Hibiscus syriacus]